MKENFVRSREERTKKLEEIALKIRRHIIREIYEAGSGHPGGSLSATEIITALYFYIMRHNPHNPKWEDRDRFVLSKGHSCPALYAALAESGYFDVKELLTLRKLGSRLQGHPSIKTPGIDICTGSLGQGLSIAVGMALGARIDRKLYRVFVLMGDGELQCGEVWEAAMAAANYRLDNITAIVDRNRLQIDGNTEKIMSLEPLSFKFKAFGWHVTEINGHNFNEIIDAIENGFKIKGKPKVVIAHTVKGKGVSFMEGSVAFHGKPPNDEQFKIAMKELGVENV
ncbi:MAG: transketolase [Methanomicrobia archaeon]|nr:transketolase [Methanomicrobia archaeon]HDM22556.1 transketolase [Methanomicrobia archaeon]